MSNVQPFYWSVRREIWESRFIFVAPVAVAILVLGAYLIGTVHLPDILMSNPRMHENTDAPPAGLPFAIATGAVLITGIVTGAFYALGALYSERRDRSILFWKSLPLSDRTVVLAKASIPLVILPAICFAVIVLLQLAMLALSAVFVNSQGANLPAFWTQWPFLRMTLMLLYGLVTLALWHAPLYGWLFMISAWAKRGPFLWAMLLPLALCVAERVAFNSSVLETVLTDRLCGSFNAAFSPLDDSTNVSFMLGQAAPMKFLENPGLWVGLLVAAGFFWAAIRLRRFRGPI